MFKDITIGQYVDGNSFLHRLDARVKIILAIVYIVVLFVINTPVSYLVFTLFTVFLIILSKIPLIYFLKGLKPMLYILIFTAVLNLFMTQGETILWVCPFWNGLKITKEGAVIAVKMILRLIYIVIGTSLLTLTTTPLMLTDGIENLLKPFEVIKVPSHEIAMMMTIAIRFIPTLAEETEKIMKAQMARGADFETGNIIRRAKAMVPILVPLFISAFKRADDLAVAMDSRCYNSGKQRTRMKQMKITVLDGIAAFGMCIFTAGIILIQTI